MGPWNHPRALCHITLTKLPVHGFGGAPRDFNFLGDLLPYLGLKPGEERRSVEVAGGGDLGGR